MTKAISAETRIGLPVILNYTQGKSVGLPTFGQVISAAMRNTDIEPKPCTKKQLTVLGIPLGHGYKPVTNQEKALKIEARLEKQAARYNDRAPHTFCIPLIARNLPTPALSAMLDTPVYKKKYGIPLLLKRTEITQINE